MTTFSELKGKSYLEKYIAFLVMFVEDRRKFDTLFATYIYNFGGETRLVIRESELQWLLKL